MAPPRRRSKSWSLLMPKRSGAWPRSRWRSLIPAPPPRRCASVPIRARPRPSSSRRRPWPTRSSPCCARISRTATGSNWAASRRSDDRAGRGPRLHLDLYDRLHAMDEQVLAEAGIEEILEQGRTGGAEIESRVLHHVLVGGDLQLVLASHRLHDCGRVGDSRREQSIGAVVAVLEQQPPVAPHHRDEVRAEADRQRQDVGGGAEGGEAR